MFRRFAFNSCWFSYFVETHKWRIERTRNGIPNPVIFYTFQINETLANNALGNATVNSVLIGVIGAGASGGSSTITGNAVTA